MNSSSPLDAQYQRIQEVLDRHGSRATPEEFRQIVNVVFHRYESAQYDQLHRSMWESLPATFDFLANTGRDFVGSQSRLLDVGCGTGLSTSLLLNTSIGPRIASGVFVDTSAEMIQIARKRSRHWGVHSVFETGTIANISGRFDVILVSSVMHHIPELGAFLKDVTERLSPGGLLIHLQDPNGDANQDVVNERKQQLLLHMKSTQLSTWQRIKRRLRPQDRYIVKTNQELLRKGIILTPLSDEDIWAITDIHDNGQGISLHEMAKALDTDMTLLRGASVRVFWKAGFRPAGNVASSRRQVFSVWRHGWNDYERRLA